MLVSIHSEPTAVLMIREADTHRLTDNPTHTDPRGRGADVSRH